MLFAVTYEIGDIWGPGGSVSENRLETLEHARTIAEIGLDQLDDGVNLTEWFDLAGDEANPRVLLRDQDPDEVVNVIQQISDELKGKRLGFVDLWEYDDLFELATKQDVDSWCSPDTKNKIHLARKAYFAAVQQLADEWAE